MEQNEMNKVSSTDKADLGSVVSLTYNQKYRSPYIYLRSVDLV